MCRDCRVQGFEGFEGFEGLGFLGSGLRECWGRLMGEGGGFRV